MGWENFFSTALTSIFSGSIVMSCVAAYTAVQNKKARVSSDMREAKRDLTSDTEKQMSKMEKELEILYNDNKLLRDYVFVLRSKIESPPPFPEGLKRV